MTLCLITLEDVTLNASQAVLKQICPFDLTPMLQLGSFPLHLRV